MAPLPAEKTICNHPVAVCPSSKATEAHLQKNTTKKKLRIIKTFSIESLYHKWRVIEATLEALDFHGKFPGRGFFESVRTMENYRWNYGVFFEKHSENKSCGTLTSLFQKVRILTMASYPLLEFSPRMY
jgi:hypothetical protein